MRSRNLTTPAAPASQQLVGETARQDMEGRQFDSKLHSSPEVRNAFWLFADAVRDDTPFLVQPEEGVVVMRLLDAIYESARTGEPVKF